MTMLLYKILELIKNDIFSLNKKINLFLLSPSSCYILRLELTLQHLHVGIK